MVANPAQDAYDIDAAGSDLPALVERVQRGGRPVVLTRDGQPAAAIVSVADAEAARRERLARVAEAARDIEARVADVGDDELDRRAKEAIAEARREPTR